MPDDQDVYQDYRIIDDLPSPGPLSPLRLEAIRAFAEEAGFIPVWPLYFTTDLISELLDSENPQTP